MTPDLTAEKQALRRELRAALKAMPAAEQAAASAAARALLRQQTIWREARRVLFYAPLPGEIDLTPLLAEGAAAGKTVALPGHVTETGRYEAFVITSLADHCAPGKFGIAEPKPGCERLALNRLDLVLTPGIAFDATGHRLGRGQGFYDRLLADTSASAIRCGVAFDLQIAERIPAEAHDIRMNCLLTPTRWRQWPS